MSDNQPVPLRKLTARRLLLLVGVSAAVAIAGTFWLGNAGAPQASECAAQPGKAAAIDAAAQGELAGIVPTAGGRAYADLKFQDATGAMLTIGDFAGKALLVNFWASWCVPCREEMPFLDALAARHNDEGFVVLPINLDIGAGGPEKGRAFLAEGNWPNLPLYADPSFEAFERLKTSGAAIGLPATLLLDEKGCEIAVLPGPAHWDTPDGDRVVEALKAL
jgi:thiol-disulfide isomerase/thioredoxin